VEQVATKFRVEEKINDETNISKRKSKSCLTFKAVHGMMYQKIKLLINVTVDRSGAVTGSKMI
jgi:hypothetical protein